MKTSHSKILLFIMFFFLATQAQSNEQSNQMAAIVKMESAFRVLNEKTEKLNKQYNELNNKLARLNRYYIKDGDNYHDIKEQIFHNNNQMLENVRSDNDLTLALILGIVSLLAGTLGIIAPLYLNTKVQKKYEHLIINIRKEFADEYNMLQNEIIGIKALNNEISAFNEQVMINGNFQLAFLETDITEKISLYETFINEISIIINRLRNNSQKGNEADDEQNIDQVNIKKYTHILATSYSNLAKAYISTKDNNKALAAYNQAIIIDDSNANFYNERGNVYMLSNDLDNALLNYNKALEINSKFGLCYLQRAQLYERRENYDMAVDDYTSALNNGVSGKIVYSKRAYSKALSYKIEGAIEDYSKALEEDSFDYATYCNRGAARFHLIAKMQKENTASNSAKIKVLVEQCFADYNQALLFKPNYTPATKNTANLFVLLGELEKAEKLYNAMLKITPYDASLYFNLGSLQLSNQQFDESELNLLKAQELTPHDSQIYFLLSELYKAMSNEPTFSDNSEQLIQKSNEYRDLYFLHLGLNQTKNIET